MERTRWTQEVFPDKEKKQLYSSQLRRQFDTPLYIKTLGGAFKIPYYVFVYLQRAIIVYTFIIYILHILGR